MNDQQLKEAANAIAKAAFRYIIATPGIDRVTALQAATDAGNKGAQAIALFLSEAGVEVKV